MRKPPPPVIWAILFVIALVIYAPSLNGGFLLDDNILIVHNEFIKDIHKIPLIFTVDAFWPNSIFFGQSYMCYRPLPALSYALDFKLWKLAPFWYHLENILLHSLAALLVFFLINSLFADYLLALITAFIFCIHPVHAEVVNFISGRADILQGIFTLLALLLYLRHLARKSGAAFIGSLLSFTLALITRESGYLVMVPLFILFAGYKARIPKSSLFAHFFSFCGIMSLYVWLRVTVLVPVEMSPRGGSGLWLDTINFSNLVFGYFKLLVFPVQMYMMRTIPEITSPWSAIGAAAFLFLVFSVTIFISALVYRKKIVIFGLAWFIGGILYLTRFMYKFSGLVSAEEHWLYLPSIGFFVAGCYLLLRLKRTKVALIVLSVLSLFYIVVANVNSRSWRDPVIFYKRQIAMVNPDISYIARCGLVDALSAKGRHKEAVSEAKQLTAYFGDDWTYVILGQAYEAMGNYKEARAAYEAALSIDYFSLTGSRCLASLCEKTGQGCEDKLMKSFPPEEARIVNFIKTGRFEEARRDLEKLLDASPSPKLYTLAGILLSKTGCYRSAIGAFRKAIQLKPDHIPAWRNLAAAYEVTREYDLAREAWSHCPGYREVKQ